MLHTYNTTRNFFTMTSVETRAPGWPITDDESLSLMVSLLMDDVQQITSSAKGKQKEGIMTDAELALQLYSEELSIAELFALDRRMSKSIQSAVRADADALAQSEREERMAQHDHDISASISRGISEPQVPDTADTEPSADELELLEKICAIYITGIEDQEHEQDQSDAEDLLADTDGQAESSSWGASRKSQRSSQRRACLACEEKKHFSSLARAPCGHEYCRDCLATLFRCAMSDETLFPPRCCRQTIPLERNQIFLPEDLVHQFRAKSVEFSTPHRTYCHEPTCSAFIPPRNYEGDVATCSDCGAQTCVTCKNRWHHDDCPNDEGLQQVLEMAEENSWQRCPRCLSMIELSHGCFHMTCKCGSQFCYLCCEPWKNCNCRHWDEHRLLNRAEVIYNRNHHDQGGNIDHIVANLRNNHECTHTSWRKRGPNICEECGEFLRRYIFECSRCNIMACRRCRFNRF
ncbi:hypothetical protein GGR53DRAFT_430471 [Hypoxylon sp. FL1150]|nr:hypothetical protein GGR53DRAFT_430471 [Hypoxylon sp. FL1150]